MKSIHWSNKIIHINFNNEMKDKAIILFIINESNKDAIESICKDYSFQSKIKQLSKALFSSLNRQFIP